MAELCLRLNSSNQLGIRLRPLAHKNMAGERGLDKRQSLESQGLLVFAAKP